MAEEQSQAATIAKKWKRKRGSLIMALHELQEVNGFVPWEEAFELGTEMGVPLARIYEVLTFYNFFKLEAPGKAVISVCTGTACYLKGNDKILKEFEKQLGIKEGTSTIDKLFHLQSVRCVGCCGLAPVIVVNGKTYGRLETRDVQDIIKEWKDHFASKEA